MFLYIYFMLAQLYETLHVGEHQIKKERDMYARLEELHTQLTPMETVCAHCSAISTLLNKKKIQIPIRIN